MTEMDETAREIDELLARREVLKGQIAECNAHRQPLAEQIAAAEEKLAHAKADLAVIDAETLVAIAPLQRELEEVGSALRLAHGRLQELGLAEAVAAEASDGDAVLGVPGVPSEEAVGKVGG